MTKVWYSYSGSAIDKLQNDRQLVSANAWAHCNGQCSFLGRGCWVKLNSKGDIKQLWKEPFLHQMKTLMRRHSFHHKTFWRGQACELQRVPLSLFLGVRGLKSNWDRKLLKLLVQAFGCPIERLERLVGKRKMPSKSWRSEDLSPKQATQKMSSTTYWMKLFRVMYRCPETPGYRFATEFTWVEHLPNEWEWDGEKRLMEGWNARSSGPFYRGSKVMLQ